MNAMSMKAREELRAISQLVASGALARVVSKSATQEELVDALAFIVLSHEHEMMGVARPVGYHIWSARVERLAKLDCDAYQAANVRLQAWLKTG